MKARLLTRWDGVRTSFWFVPTLMLFAATALALGMVRLDGAVADENLEELGWLYTGSADGARSILSSIASSMITVAGLTFSLAITAMVLASQQFGPRLLRNFMSDTGNQVVLGTFVATFLYSLLVLRTVRGGSSTVVPYLSITMAILLAVASLAVLIYFIHHVASSIQASNVISRVGDELDATLEKLYPSSIGRADEDDDLHPPLVLGDKGGSIAAKVSGYLQVVDGDALMELATRRDVLFKLQVQPGDHILEGETLAVVWPAGRLGENDDETVRKALSVGGRRTPIQDPAFAIDQLSEIALRALSPGINDPSTAVSCVDRLGESLAHLTARVFPSGVRRDDDGIIRVVSAYRSFADLVDTSFSRIRQYGSGSVPVVTRLLETLTGLAAQVSSEPDRAALRRHADATERAARRSIQESEDLAVVGRRYASLLDALGSPAQRS